MREQADRFGVQFVGGFGHTATHHIARAVRGDILALPPLRAKVELVQQLVDQLRALDMAQPDQASDQDGAKSYVVQFQVRTNLPRTCLVTVHGPWTQERALPCTLYPIPYTLYPIPYTIYPITLP
jgi:hypothetical protein